MRLAEILSDLMSLRVCVREPSFPLPACLLTPLAISLLTASSQDPTAALALVSVRPSTKQDSVATSTNTEGKESTARRDTTEDEDADLVRAKELVRLHYEVKVAQQKGALGRGLEEARRSVEKALGG